MIANRKTKTRLLAALLGAGLLASVSDTSALCARDADTEERELYAAIGCNRDAYRWVAREMEMSSQVWKNRGWDDACNPTKEFPKVWMSVYLAWHGVDWDRAWVRSEHDGVVLQLSRAFHSSDRDYGPATHARGKVEGLGRYHRGFRTRITDSHPDYGPEVCALFHYRGTGRNDWVTFLCPAFRNGLLEASVGASGRAGLLLHEAWHAHNRTGPEGAPWMVSHNLVSGTKDGYNARVYRSSYPRTKLWDSRDRGPMRSFQVQHRMMCDMADWPSGWVPDAVFRAADVRAVRLALQKLEPSPPFNCGPVQPYGSQLTEVDPYTRTLWYEQGRCGLGGTECTSQAGCSGDHVCEIADGQTVGCCIAVVY